MASCETVRFHKLYKPDPSAVEQLKWCSSRCSITKDTVLWLHGNRRSSLGGYIGTFSLKYPHRNVHGEIVGYSPSTGTEFYAGMDLVTPIDDDGPLRFAAPR